MNNFIMIAKLEHTYFYTVVLEQFCIPFSVPFGISLEEHFCTSSWGHFYIVPWGHLNVNKEHVDIIFVIMFMLDTFADLSWYILALLFWHSRALLL